MIVALCAIAACGGRGPTDLDDLAPTTVALTASSVTLNALGQEWQVGVLVLDQLGQILDNSLVVWSTSESAVVTVDTDGLLTSVSNGTARIFAVAGEAADTLEVTVAQEADSIATSSAMITLAGVGDTAQVTAVAYDAQGAVLVSPDFTWESADEGVATVGTDGLVTAVSAGTTQVTVTEGAVSRQVEIEVTVPASIGSLYRPAYSY